MNGRFFEVTNCDFKIGIDKTKKKCYIIKAMKFKVYQTRDWKTLVVGENEEYVFLFDVASGSKERFPFDKYFNLPFVEIDAKDENDAFEKGFKIFWGARVLKEMDAQEQIYYPIPQLEKDKK